MRAQTDRLDLIQLQVGGTGLVVLLSEKANLSAASGMRDADAQGWYVYNTQWVNGIKIHKTTPFTSLIPISLGLTGPLSSLLGEDTTLVFASLLIVLMFVAPFGIMIAVSFFRRVQGAFYEPSFVFDNYARFLSLFFGGGGNLLTFRESFREALNSPDVGSIVLDIDNRGANSSSKKSSSSNARWRSTGSEG